MGSRASLAQNEPDAQSRAAANEIRVRARCLGVPDVAFVAADRLSELSDEALQSPPLAPTVAVEVLSPDDDARDVESKTDVYLRGGSALVISIDPATRSVALHDAVSSRQLQAHDILRHSALPDFELPVGAFFADALDRD